MTSRRVWGSWDTGRPQNRKNASEKKKNRKEMTIREALSISSSFPGVILARGLKKEKDVRLEIVEELGTLALV